MRSAMNLLLLFAAGMLVAFVVTYPLFLHLGSLLTFQSVGGEVRVVDQLHSIEYLTEARTSVINGRSLWDLTYQNSNYAISRLYLLIGGVLAVFLSPIVAFNIYDLVIVMLCFVTMFAYARESTHSVIASLFAGIVYAASNYSVHHIIDSNVASLYWIPLLFLLLDRTMTRSSRIWPLLLAGSCAGQLLSAELYALYLFIVLPIYTIVAHAKRFARRDVWPRLGLCLIATLLSCSYFLWLRTTNVSRQYSDRQALAYSLSNFGDLVAPSSEVGLGIASGLAAAVGAVLLAPQSRTRCWALLAVALVSLLMMLGPFHPFAPYSLVEKVIPPFTHTRTPLRFVVFLIFVVAVLSAHAIAAIEARLASTKLRVSALALLIVCIVTIDHAGSIYWVRKSDGQGIWTRTLEQVQRAPRLRFERDFIS